MKLIIALTLAAAFGSVSLAADTLRVTLDQVIEMAGSRSLASRKVEADSVSMAGTWKAAKGGWYPQLRISGFLPSWNRKWFSTSNRGSVESSVMSGWATLSQDLPWGASLEFESGLSKSVSKWSADSTSLTTYQHSRSVSLNQPLLNGNPVGRKHRLDEIDYETNRINTELARRDLRIAAINAYFSVVSAEQSLDIARQGLSQGDTSASIAERKLRAGLIPEVDLLQIQVDVARRSTAVSDAEATLEGALDDLRIAIGVSAGEPVEVVADQMTDDVPGLPIAPEVETRPDFRLAKLAVERSELEYRAQMFAAYGEVSADVSYGASLLSDSLSGVQRSPDNETISAGISITLPVFGFGSTSGRIQQIKANLRGAKIEYALQTARISANQAEKMRRLKRARERIEIAERARDLSQRSYDISAQRFANGLISSRDLLSTQLDLTNSRREAVSARIDYRLLLAAFERDLP